MRTVIYTLLLLVGASFSAFGTHIIGGSLTMTQLDKTPGKYKITLNLWVNTDHLVNNEDVLMLSEENWVRIIKKSNGVYMNVPRLSFEKFDNVIFDNTVCEHQNDLHIREYHYSGTIQLNINDFDEDEGYYLAYERCCRNEFVTNIEKPGETGMVLYLEFPPLKKYPNYSSPDFPVLKGDYICVNKPFKFDFSASDVDNDELRYSIVTPWKGNSLPNVPKPIASAAPYTPVSWKAGFSEQSSIKGTPALSIDPKTGLLTVKTSEKGTFTFTVQVEEFRNGKKIGAVRHDFQFVSINCIFKTPPIGVITYEGKAVKTVESCGEKDIILETAYDPNINYQWQLNGVNISYGVAEKIMVKDTGLYTVVKSFKNECTNDTSSAAVKVTSVSPTKLKIKAASLSICDGQNVKLSVGSLGNSEITWYEGNSIIKKDSIININKPGTYSVSGKVIVNGCLMIPDTIKISAGTKPTLPSITNLSIIICQGDSAKLEVPVNANYTYRWYADGKQLINKSNFLYTKSDGKYFLEVTDAKTGCTNRTPEWMLSTISPTTIKFDTINPICGREKIPLSVTPKDGVFSGIGVSNNTFDPAIAGVGRHVIIYKVGVSTNCLSQVSRIIEVKPAITLGVPNHLTVRPNEPTLIKIKPTVNNLFYNWQPPNGLDNNEMANPTVTVTENTKYTLFATSTDGCKVSESIFIDVGYSLTISTAFSPNGDNLNEYWLIKGIERFPECEIWVFNSWGENIYYSKGYDNPWDGKYKGEVVPTGTYLYKLDTKENGKVYQGSLTVIY